MRFAVTTALNAASREAHLPHISGCGMANQARQSQPEQPFQELPSLPRLAANLPGGKQCAMCFAHHFSLIAGGPENKNTEVFRVFS
jgi:hypothetical protein